MISQRSPQPLDHGTVDQMRSALDGFAGNGITCDWLGKAECGYSDYMGTQPYRDPA